MYCIMLYHNMHFLRDILTLREITRKKFMIFATQERYLEKQREAAFQEGLYAKIQEYQEVNIFCKHIEFRFIKYNNNGLYFTNIIP